MSRYVKFGIEDMRPLFPSNWEEGVQGRSEIVFDMPLRDGIIVRVWTSIHTKSELNAKNGDDAIRVCAIDTRTGRGYIAAPKVLRVEGWRKNLGDRIEYVISEANKRLQREARQKATV